MHHGAMPFSVMSRSESLAAFGAAPFEHEAAVFGGHARAKTVRLRSSSVIRLESALRHSKESPIKTKTLRLIFVRSYVKKTAGSLGVERRGTTSASTAANGTVTRSSQAAGRGLAVNQLVRKPYLQFLCLAC